ncbi:SGNH/GDSL hydrolase family protein [filamentous cyanobacterium LEGE 11480]|uniref:SGNH/GDSL hydrolase family protein n=1 Tax=Romeriopsis navalis LEGE 11480 TaxID=2777977 RepID=A0A928VKD7_9CYAN|nr:SGNH/GDSL hydrolase family protein [Romeriopsis navalis LEGE 11480]
MPLPLLLAALPLALLVLELLLRLGVGLAGKGDELNAYQGEPTIATAYRFKPFTADQQTVKGIPGYGELAVQSHPLTGYQLVPNQENAALKINNQGLRSAADIPTNKPKNEVRILVIGGSTAFGALTSKNASTFAQQLENRLNQQVKAQKSNPAKFRPNVLPYFADEMQKALALPAKVRNANYRVINAAVPGYLSGNTLADFTTRLQRYQPNIVVLMNGYSDLLTPATQVATDLATDQLAAQPVSHLWGSVREGIQGLFHHLYLTKTFRYWILKPEPKLEQLVNPLDRSGNSLPDQLGQDDKALKQRVDRYRNNLQQLANITGNSKIPLVVSLTPELHQRQTDKQSEAEKRRFEALGKTYQERVKTGYTALDQAVKQVKSKRRNLIIVPLSKTINQFDGEVFQDTIHLTDEAQTAVSNRLYQTIAPMLLVKPKPFGS